MAESPDHHWGDEWDDVFDVVVIGAGAAGTAAAASAAAAGAEVALLDKAAFTGGTTAKSGGVMWVPNNPWMLAQGLVDERDDMLRYLARTAYPTQYRSAHATLGLDQQQYEPLVAFLDHGGGAIQELIDIGALEIEPVAYPDYYAELAEAKVSTGHVIQPRFPQGWRRGIDPTGGQLLVDALERGAVANHAKVLLDHRVVHVVRNHSGAVIGVEARTGVRTVLLGARRGVIFASGGFLHDRAMARAFLRGPVMGGAAADTATGDLVRIAMELGAQLGNMSHAWWDQVAVEHALTVPSTIKDVYSPFGDSMVMVNRRGVRVVNEKAVYNERGNVHFHWDPTTFEYPNLLLFMIFDDAVVDNPDPSRFRWPVPQRGEPMPPFVLSAPTLAELAEQIRARLASLAGAVGEIHLADDFDDRLQETVGRFNQMAANGVDEDFGRGVNSIERTWAGQPRPGMPNATMAPIAASGPYHCVILGPGALDTKGGPVIDGHGRILDLDGSPIEGLYGAGNCVAAPSGQAYWGPGGTIGPAMVFGVLAARHAVAGEGRHP